LKKPALIIPVEWLIIIALVAIKLGIHFLTSTNYGLHRDAYLYFAQSEHLAWGFISVPPFMATIIHFSVLLMGDSVFALRVFPALAGAINIILIGLMVREMGGKSVATFLACSAYLLSPAFLRSNSLLQPVSFDQMFWLLAAFFVVKLVSTRDPWYWLAIGITAGIGMMNKYAIAFFFLGLFFALFSTQDRKWFASRYLYIGLIIACVLMLPNIWWQYRHNWPIVAHMRELRETQLVHVSYAGFLFGQLWMNMNVIFIWIAGLFFFLKMKQGRGFRILGFVFLYSLLILMLLNGKAYYTLGLYPFLFAGGGIAFESWFQNRYKAVPYLVFILMLLILIPGLPLSLPVFSHQGMVEYGKQALKYGAKGAFIWEDGVARDLPQDYADMTGWEEMVQKVARVYHSFPEDLKKQTLILGESYGQAGALNYFRKKYELPEPVSFSESFVFWAPDNINASQIIVVDEIRRFDSEYFRSVVVLDSVTDPYARDRGFIHLFSEPVGNLAEDWKRLSKEEKTEFSRKLKRAERKALKKEDAARRQIQKEED
jgi:hypothetical protein